MAGKTRSRTTPQEAEALLTILAQPYTSVVEALGGDVVARRSLNGVVAYLGYFPTAAAKRLVRMGHATREKISGGTIGYFITEAGRRTVEHKDGDS